MCAHAQDEEEAEAEVTGLDAVVDGVQISDETLPEFASLLAEVGQVNLNVSNTVQPSLKVTVNVLTPKTIREILKDLSDQYDLYIDDRNPDNIIIRPGSEKPTKADEFLERDFVLNFSRPSEVVDLVQNLLSDRDGADVVALDSLDTIRVRDISEAVARIAEFLNRIDIPQQTTVFPVLYGDAELIAEIILERLPDLEENAMTVDTANSQILVRTTLDNLAEIQLLIETLDVKKEIRVFHIGFHPVDDVVSILEDLELLSEEATITFNEYTGKLIIQDTTERLDRIAEAIQAYDQPRSLVFFEAEILDVNADYNFNWDPTIELQDSARATASATSGVLTDGDTFLRLAGSDAFEFSHLDAGDYLARLMAHESDSDVHTIASPRVLVEMQEVARLNVGSEEPYGVRSFQNNQFGTGTDLFSQRIREVGVRLIIEVFSVSDRGYLEFNVALENSALGGRVDIGGDTQGLRVLTTNVETTVVMKDERTLMLGGLFQRSEEENSGGIPYLSKVPGLRMLFSNVSRRDQRRKLLLFITPHILNVDLPLEKYRGDEETVAMGQEISAMAGTADAGVSVTDSPEWINRGGRWGFMDDSGNFVDRTEIYQSAYQAAPAADYETTSYQDEPLGEPGEGTTSASVLLRQLEELPAEEGVVPAQPRLIPESPQQAPEPQVEQQAKPEPKAAPKKVQPKPKPKKEAPAQPKKPAPSPAKNPLVGRAASDALKKPADNLGAFKGTISELLIKAGKETGVRFSIPTDMPRDAQIEVDGKGKTFYSAIQEALGQHGMMFRIRSDKGPLIRKKPTRGSSPKAKPSQPVKPAPKTPAAPPPPEEKTDPQTDAGVPEFFRDPWDEDAEPLTVTFVDIGAEGVVLSGGENRAISSVSPRTVATQPAEVPARQGWEVPLEIDTNPVPRGDTRLPRPRGYRTNRHGELTEEVWSGMLEGELISLETPVAPNTLGARAPRHIQETRGSRSPRDSSLNAPSYRVETVSQVQPKETPKKKGAWSAVRKFFGK